MKNVITCDVDGCEEQTAAAHVAGSEWAEVSFHTPGGFRSEPSTRRFDLCHKHAQLVERTIRDAAKTGKQR